MKKIKIICALSLLFVLSITGAILATRYFTVKEVSEKTGIVSAKWLSVEERIPYIENFENPYAGFLDDEKAEYIIAMSQNFNLDPTLVVSILEKENPTLKTDAVSSMNEDGTVDLGLFQLNSSSLDNFFLKEWWPKEFGEFNAGNWKHNTYIAIRYLKDLQSTFGENNIFYIAAGYNAGIPRAFNEWTNKEGYAKLPYSTKYDYAPTVKNLYNKWKIITEKENS